MFKSAVQPPTISLFSSTGSDPLGLWSQTLDSSKPDLSLIHLLHDMTSTPSPTPPASLIGPAASEDHGYLLDQTVLHIQGPDLRNTHIQCPPAPSSAGSAAQGFPNAQEVRNSAEGATPLQGNHDLRGRNSSIRADLGIRHQCVHLQVRNLGKDWSFEIGVMDQAGREGILRFSTFQTSPRLRLRLGNPSILHLPLSFASETARSLTSWSTIDLHLPTYMSHFSSTEIQEEVESEEIIGVDKGHHSKPQGVFSHTTYIRIYATCRLRRIWFDSQTHNERLPWEFELYSKP